MSVLKCKMCGGELNVTSSEQVVECEYCGSRQTVPKADDEKKVNLFNRANRLRMACEFDKAAGIYEQIIAEFPKEAEAYWGLCLSNYGIEYVDDPTTAKKIPTCHRASFEKMRKDENYELALENADTIARIIYEEQAKEIDRIMGEILKVSRDEEPYDIFICYKESDSYGSRTLDSVFAQDIYDALTERGYRVFFSRITLEDKLGTQYEPYIFSALNSAKIMLVVGTDYEYMNAVWVKNEWSRFIKLMAKDKTKILIPCYKDMDPYDMPDEFKPYQSQDCGKLGFLQDIVRGIDKLSGRIREKTVAGEASSQGQGVIQQASGGPNTEALIKRGHMSLEDRAFDEAKQFFDDALNIDPENAEAYLGLFMSDIKAEDKNTALKSFIENDFQENRYWQRAKKFAEGDGLQELREWETKREDFLAKQALEVEEKKKADEKINQANKEFWIRYKNGTLGYPTDIQSIFKEIKAGEKELEAMGKRIYERKEYLSTLGLFKGREKQTVQSDIDALVAEKNSLVNKVRELKRTVQSCVREKAKSMGIQGWSLLGCQSGDIVTFGVYEQGNGKQPIEWVVLSAEDHRCLLISKYALKAWKYDTELEYFSWEKWELRTWLNQKFYMEAFTVNEQKLISETIVPAEKNSQNYRESEAATNDKVFLLSISEASKYFGCDEDRKCVPTAFAIRQSDSDAKNSLGVSSSESLRAWWLRSPCSASNTPASVLATGAIHQFGRLNTYNLGIRPALWIDLKQ